MLAEENFGSCLSWSVWSQHCMHRYYSSQLASSESPLLLRNLDDFVSGYVRVAKKWTRSSRVMRSKSKLQRGQGTVCSWRRWKIELRLRQPRKHRRRRRLKESFMRVRPWQRPHRSGGIYTVEFHFPEPIDLTPPLLQLIEVNFGYPNRQDFRLSKVDMGIDMGTRVGIVGPNGTGKSTLRLAGDLGKCEGARNWWLGDWSKHDPSFLPPDNFAIGVRRLSLRIPNFPIFAQNYLQGLFWSVMI